MAQSLFVALFLHLLELAVAITPVLGLLLLLAPGPGRRYSPRLRGLVWLAVAVRLLVPLNVTAPGAPFRFDLGAATSTSGVARTADPDAALLLEGAETLEQNLMLVPEADGSDGIQLPWTVDPALFQEPQAPRLDRVGLLAGGWLAGALGYGLFLLGSHLRAVRKLRRWSVAVLDPRSMEVLQLVCEEYGIKRAPRLYRNSRVESPMLLGLWRPRILLPDSVSEDRQLAMVLSHELCHLRRRDLWRKMVLLLAGVVYWFHPLVHLMRRQAEWDMEMACDGEVLDGANSLLRREYGFAVLKVLEGARGRALPLSTHFFGGRRQMVRRFRHMVDQSPKRRGVLPLAMILAAVSVCGAFVGCSAPEADPVEPEGVAAPAPLEVADNPSDTYREDEAVPSDGAGPTVLLLEEMEREFLGDLDFYQELAARTQNELETVYQGIEWSAESLEGGSMTWPLPGVYTVTSSYGFRFGGSDFHTGVDITGQDCYGQDVVAAADGVVRFVNWNYNPGMGYGIYLILDHGDELSTLYAQLSDVVVEEGDKVEQGQTVAKVGSTGFSTGPHLHFEVRESGIHTDPMGYLLAEGGEEPEPVSMGFVLPVDGGMGHFELSATAEGLQLTQERDGVVRASAAGVVMRVTSEDGDSLVIIDHGNGYQTRYAGDAAFLVEEGETVETAQTIGALNPADGVCTLQFNIYYNGRQMDPMNYIL